MKRDKPEPKLTASLKVDGLDDVNRHDLVRWLRERATELENASPQHVPAKLSATL
jgi:hypothetical protein